MLRTGEAYLEALRDGRRVYIGKECVRDVTCHPAFRNGARSMSAIYDAKAAPENRGVLSFEEDGEDFSGYFRRAASREDLAFRSQVHRKIAEMSYGMFGRSPDHVTSFVTGMTMNAPLLVHMPTIC